MTDKDYACGDRGNVYDWTQIKVTVKTERLDELVAVMSMINNNLMIEDYSDIDLATCYGDLIDESILNADTTHASVSFFVPGDRSYADDMAFLRERLTFNNFDDADIKVLSGLKEEDWANSWKAYYKPLKIGNIVIVPAWESYAEQPGEIIVKMNPGMAFGTGTHETTRLIIGLLQEYVKPGSFVLDVGTGSGILAICAAKLGAEECRAYDIDPMSVRVANENILDSGLENKIECKQSDLLKSAEHREGGYDVICANIVADIIIRMTPDVHSFFGENTVLLASGIISERCRDVEECFEQNGFYIAKKSEDNGWCALAVKRK